MIAVTRPSVGIPRSSSTRNHSASSSLKPYQLTGWSIHRLWDYLSMLCRFCDNTYRPADCVEAGCNYHSCGRRESSFFDTDYGGSSSYGVGFVCLERCDPGPAKKTCEQYSDFDCPLLAGCALAQEPPALPGAASGSSPPSSSSSTSAVDDTDEEPLFEGSPVPQHATPAPGTSPVSSRASYRVSLPPLVPCSTKLEL